MALGDTARLLASLDLQDNFSGKVSGILGSVGRLQGGLGQMARGTGQVASGLGRIGFAASTVAAGGLAAVIKTAANFEQAFTGIEKTVEATPAQFAKLNEQFREMARTIPLSFEELAGIGEAGGALGIARKDLLDFTDVVARLAVSTNLSSDQAATALGQLGNVLHLRGADFRDFADSLVALGNAGASTEDQIVEMAARFGAAGNSAGLTKEEILALSSAVASMGINVEAGGSALSRIFSSVATNIGTSSDKAIAFAKVLGQSAAEFRRNWQRDALGTFQEFLGELGKLDQFKQASVLQDIGITNVRDVNTVRLMSQNVGFVADQLKIARNAQGALNTESQKFFDTASGQWKVLINNLRDAGATIGNEVLPVFKDLVKQFTDFLQRPETTQRLKQFGRDIAETLRTFDFKSLIDTAKTAVEIAKTAFDIFNALPGPIKAALIGGVALNRATFGGFGLLLRGAGNIAGGALSTALGGRGGAVGGALAGVFGGRGASPANPLWVRMAGGIPGLPTDTGFKPPSWWAPIAGAGGLTGLVTLVAGIATPLLAFDLIPSLFPGKAAPPGTILDPKATRFTLPGTKGPEGTKTDPINVVVPPTFGGQFTGLIPSFGANQVLTPTAPEGPDPVKVTNPDDIGGPSYREAKAARLAASAAFKNMTLELRLIRDKTFKPKLDSAEFIRILRQTSEFGEKGRGTTIEQGPRTGRDPFGQAFLALARRLENPKAPVVLGEINRHIIAAEQVQRTALRTGDVHAARLLQQTIDGLHQLVGTVDRHRPILSEINRKTDGTARAINTTSATTQARLLDVITYGRQAAANTGVLTRKDFSPKVNVAVRSSTSISVNDVVRAVNTFDYAVNTFGNKLNNIPL